MGPSANYGEAEPDNMHEAELRIKSAFQPRSAGLRFELEGWIDAPKAL
jgi:hypothetical protein